LVVRDGEQVGVTVDDEAFRSTGDETLLLLAGSELTLVAAGGGELVLVAAVDVTANCS